MHPTILPRRFAPAASAKSSYLKLSGCVLLSQGGPGVRLAWHRRQRQELRRQRCTARRIGGCDNHCDDNDEQHDSASHGWRGRDVHYARTIKETQAKPASLIPPEPTTRNLLAGFLALVPINNQKIEQTPNPYIKASLESPVDPYPARSCWSVAGSNQCGSRGVQLRFCFRRPARRCAAWLPTQPLPQPRHSQRCEGSQKLVIIL
jgi:hypothetical protein